MTHDVAEADRDAADGRPDEECPVRGILDRIGDKWSLLVVLALANGSLRFGALRRTIGDISQRMLSETLRHLQREGLVGRIVHASSPPAVEYHLTELGRSFLIPVGSLVDWADARGSEIRGARSAFDRAADETPMASHG